MSDMNEDLIRMLASMTSEQLPAAPHRQIGRAPEHEVPGWEANIAPGEAQHGLYRFDEKVSSEVLEVQEVIEADDVPMGLMVRITPADNRVRTRYVPIDVVVTRDIASALLEATGVPWTPETASGLRDWVAAAVRAHGVPRQRGIERPRWEGDALVVPGRDLRIIPRSGATFLGAYGRAAGDEQQAIDDWRLALSNAMTHPKLAIVMGSAAISPYLIQMGQRAFVQHTYADSRQGKTTALEIAMAIFGDPADLLATWNTTKNAAMARMEGANILPVALDETGAAGAFKDELIEAVVFGAASGQGRGRARAGGGLREDAQWRLTLLSTGERRLTTASGLSGTRARVLEIEAPITPTREDIEEIHQLAIGAYGWPLAWMAAQPRTEAVMADFEAMKQSIVTADDSMTRTIETLVALAATGFRALARASGCEDIITMTDAIGIAESVASAQRNHLLAEGISVADRLYDALMERVSRRPWAYPTKDKDVDAGREREGVTTVEGTGFFAKAVADIAKDIKLDDPLPALRGLAKDGRLLAPDHSDGQSRLQRPMRVGTASKVTKVYMIAVEQVEVEK